ncbi:MAG TPA: DUF420 domain-containing protein [Bryobacteraceae bacterium]|nr:DUF420 domain-containing protein [Bryobacteraceae bacterium]
MISVHDLPALNATLNATAALLLILGYTLIRRRKIAAHRRVMGAAFGVSIVFLISYLVYHYNVGSVRFQRTGWIRTLYLIILASHTILASAVPILASVTLYRAWKGDFIRHRNIARWTFPIWLYVSVTGVVVYGMLYRL